jgi:deazaflavin-dependent oxidoreductase (nitroreductase family)
VSADRAMTTRDRRRRQLAMVFWRVFNPVARALAGLAPWWVVLETRGRRSGKPRRVPLAAGPRDGPAAWLISVHGTHASFARNIRADPRVRLKLRGLWLEGTARLLPMDEKVLRRFNRYARGGPRALGIDPKLVRVDLTGEGG